MVPTARLERRDSSHLVGVLAAAGTEPHGGRERRAALEPHAGAVLEVRANEQRQAGSALEDIELRRDVERRADRDDDSANPERVHGLERGLEGLAVQGRVVAQEPREDQLAHLLAERERRQERVHRYL
jgi:hypothetical protein